MFCWRDASLLQMPEQFKTEIKTRPFYVLSTVAILLTAICFNYFIVSQHNRAQLLEQERKIKEAKELLKGIQ